MKFAFLLLLILFWQPAPAEDDDESVTPADNNEYRGGTLRMGPFAVGNIKTRAYFGPVDIPLRGAIDISEDLGLGDSPDRFSVQLHVSVFQAPWHEHRLLQNEPGWHRSVGKDN